MWQAVYPLLASQLQFASIIAYQKGCDCVATKSVLKTIDIKKRKTALALVNALENAKGKHAQPVVNRRTFSDASREEIRKMFGDNK